MHYLIWQRPPATGSAGGVRPRHSHDIEGARPGAAQVPAITRETAAYARAATRFAPAHAAVSPANFETPSVCGWTYRSVRNGRAANRPIAVAFGVATGGEHGILGMRAGDG